MIRHEDEELQLSPEAPDRHSTDRDLAIDLSRKGPCEFVLNSGSSSVKFRVLDVDREGSTREIRPDRALIRGAVKGIGNTASFECEVEETPPRKPPE